MLTLQQVSKIFNAGRDNEFRAVNGVTLTLPQGGVTVLKGPSGSGKTTLLSMIGGMARPTSGRIRLSGFSFPWAPEGEAIDLSALPERFLTDIRRRLFGFVFQQFNLVRGIDVLENVMLPAYPLGGDGKELKRRATALLDRFSLARRTNARVEWLSGGEMQRVAIARALVNDPPVIIADEPTAHLDTRLAAEFMAMVARLEEEGKTVVIASHDPIVCGASIAGRIVEMRDGAVVEVVER